MTPQDLTRIYALIEAGCALSNRDACELRERCDGLQRLLMTKSDELHKMRNRVQAAEGVLEVAEGRTPYGAKKAG